MLLHILLAGTNVLTYFIGWYRCDRTFYWLVQMLVHILLAGTNVTADFIGWYKFHCIFNWLVQLLLHILLVGAELDPRDSLVATLPKLSVMAGLGLPSHRMSNVSMLKHPRTSTFGNSQLSGIKPFVIAS